jgi:hypothetical protein
MSRQRDICHPSLALVAKGIAVALYAANYTTKSLEVPALATLALPEGRLERVD